MDLLGELDITFIRQQQPGQLVNQGGDIDNRIKTLFDALRVPTKSEVTQLGEYLQSDEFPMFCLFEDDFLISSANIETDRLLRPAKERQMLAIIQVTVQVTRVTIGTIGLLG